MAVILIVGLLGYLLDLLARPAHHHWWVHKPIDQQV
jgi:hypothetical protein